MRHDFLSPPFKKKKKRRKREKEVEKREKERGRDVIKNVRDEERRASGERARKRRVRKISRERKTLS